MGGLNNRNCIVLQFQKLEVGGGGDELSWFLLRAVREGSVPRLSPWLADGCLSVHSGLLL